MNPREEQWDLARATAPRNRHHSGCNETPGCRVYLLWMSSLHGRHR